MVWFSIGSDLVWQEWDEVYIVYQPSSTETHVFNDTTAFILNCLEKCPLSTEAVRDKTEVALGLGQGKLVIDDVTFALQRLEELGLIECLDLPLVIQ